jgi:hypothetical protein
MYGRRYGISVAENLTIGRTDRQTLPDCLHLPPSESIEYLQADRRRTEHRGSFGYRLRSNGRTRFCPAPRTALITRCDLKQTFHLNLDDREYAVSPLHTFPTPEEILALAGAAGRQVVAPQREPTVLVETTTVDTGERRELFGHTARHVLTTRRIIPLAGAKRGADTTVTDGWYIDLNTDIACEPSWRSARSGHAFVTFTKQGEEGDVPTFKDVGEPESGFAVASKRTSSGTITASDGSTRQHVSTWETEVTELSAAAIDPALFEIPSGFRSVERIRQEPVPPLVIRLTQAYERLVSALARVTHRLNRHKPVTGSPRAK